MMLASKSLEEAMFAALSGDDTLLDLLGGAKLFDTPRRDVAFPYLTLTTDYSRDWSTGTEQGEEHRLIINVWAGLEERLLIQSLLAAVRDILSDPALPMENHHLVNLQIQRVEIRKDRKDRCLQGLMQLRAVTETQVA